MSNSIDLSDPSRTTEHHIAVYLVACDKAGMPVPAHVAISEGRFVDMILRLRAKVERGYDNGLHEYYEYVGLATAAGVVRVRRDVDCQTDVAREITP